MDGNLLAIGFIAVCLLIVAAFAAFTDRDQNREIDRLEARVVQLEIFRCGFEQFDDGSVRPQRNDQIRFDCITNAVP